jgi:Domain of unknown function (DUF4296)
MRTGLLIICCSIIIAGCKNKNSVPAGIIPQKKMQAIIWDMMRADQFLTDFVLNKDTSLDKRTESIRLYTQVFTIHQISKEQYEESFSFYKTHPALFKAIMDTLSQPKTAETPTEMIKQPVPEDSLRVLPGKKQYADSIKPLRRKKILPAVE